MTIIKDVIITILMYMGLHILLQMTEVFDVYEANFYNSLRSAQKSLKHPNPTILEISQASQSLKQAAQQLNKMQIQYNINRQKQMKSKIDVFKQQLRNYKRDLNKAEARLKQQHIQQQSGPLFQSEEAEKGINPLIQAKRQMYQNEQMSNQVATGIKRNNEILIKNINRMGDINNQLTVAHKLLNSIKNKFRKNKLIMWGTIGFLIFVLVLVIYSYFGGTPTTVVHQTSPNTSNTNGNSSNQEWSTPKN